MVFNDVNNHKRILVVDDEADILDVIRQWLQLDGSTVCTFTDPLGALEHFNLDPKDHHMVICDIKMPGMNGYEFVKQIRKINPKVKIILMTAFEIEDKELSRILTDVKVDAFIKKPFSFVSLKSIIVQQQKIS